MAQMRLRGYVYLGIALAIAVLSGCAPSISRDWPCDADPNTRLERVVDADCPNAGPQYQSAYPRNPALTWGADNSLMGYCPLLDPLNHQEVQAQ